MKKTEEGTGKRKCGVCKVCILALSALGLALAVYNLRRLVTIEVNIDVETGACEEDECCDENCGEDCGGDCDEKG